MSLSPTLPPSLPPAPPRGPWWQRLHGALMPDYNRAAATFWWLVVVAGTAVLLTCVVQVAALPWLAWVQIAGGLLLAMGAGLFPVRVPGTKQSFVAGEIFIFLVLLVHGPQAAALVAAGEAAMGSYRTSKRWTSRIISPASAALSMWLTGSLLQAALASLQAAGWDSAAPLLAATTVFAGANFLLNTQIMVSVPWLKRGEPWFRPLHVLSDFRWVGLAYAGSACVATLLFVTYRAQGSGVLMVMLPLLAMLLVTLHFYFNQQEAGEALREASAGVAAREAAMAEREARAAAQHLSELQLSERRFHSAFTHAAIGMALLAFDGRVLLANPALCAALGLGHTGLVSQRFQDLVLLEDRPRLERRLGLSAGGEFEPFADEVRCELAGGGLVSLAVHCSFFTEPGSAAPCLILQAQDVTARRRAEAGLQHLAFHDTLTGLPNRRRFMECLGGAVARCQADARHTWAVMFIDFDRFKLVNDSLGHHAGDELLLQLARRVQEKLRPSDILARLGGDEFAILADSIEHERDAVMLAERVMEALRSPFVLGQAELTASASIGITFSALGYTSADDVLRDADTAMYKAKSDGKARYALFDTGLHTAVSKRLRLEGELRQGIEQGQLTVEYQPLFKLEPAAAGAPASGHGALVGFEALVRWVHPNDGVLPPSAFLPMAEESGLVLQLSDFVLHCACQQLRRWQLLHPALAGLTMSVNLSAHDLAHPPLVARVGRAVVEAGLRPEHLTLELTENIVMAHIEGAPATLAELRRLGVHLAVDDFGTGASSLSHLARLPVDSLKIDRSFVAHLKPGSDDAAVVAAIVQMGSALRKGVVAEGIESAAQLAQLRAMGCAYGQGFYLARPLSGPATSEWLRGLHG